MSSGVKILHLQAKRDLFIIDVPSLEIRPGEVVCLMGKSGSGKSSILEVIAGFLPAVSAQIEVDGKEISLLPPEKRRIGYVFQKPSLFPHLTLIKNVAFPLEVSGMDKRQALAKASQWLERVQLSALANKYSAEVSGGEAQRAVLARALVAGFPFLLLDEPFTALDISLRKEMRSLLKELVQENQVCGLLVTHDADDVLALSEQAAVIEAGKLVFQGSAEEVVSRFR